MYYSHFAIICCFAAFAGAGLLSGGSVAADARESFQLVSRMNAADAERESTVAKVVSTRRYVLRNKRWDNDAVMVVRITSQPNASKHFEIVSMENAEGLQRKVLHKLIEAEVEASRTPRHEVETRISSENYDFAVIGSERMEGRDCVVLELKPKRSSKYLIAGKAWVDPKENATVRVEGQTARSLSFWIGKPRISQTFRKVDGVWVSAINRSVSDVKLIGRTELTVDFVDYDIVNSSRHVAHNPAPAPARGL